MVKKIIVTVDVERDISKYLNNSYIGVEQGIPALLSVLNEFRVKADFFITGDICAKYPLLIKRILEEGHDIGAHGFDHGVGFDYYCTNKTDAQYKDLSRTTELIEKTTGIRPKMFRAPNFSVNNNTIKVLEKLRYEIDSSVLPGRWHRKWNLFTIYDFRYAPRELYNPSHSNVCKKGGSPIIEVPITENPSICGAPIGAGYFNTFGIDETLRSIEKVKESYIIYLIHPWELVDLGQFHPSLRDWLQKACSNNFDNFRQFIELSQKNYCFSTIEDLTDKYIGRRKII